MMFLSFVLGALGWSLSEYLIHRFDGHGMRGKTPLSKEHLAHHRDPRTFAANWKKAAVAVLVTLVMAPIAGFAFTGGFVLMYLTYEVIHRRIHTHAPIGFYGRWARRHHLLHHHPGPRDEPRCDVSDLGLGVRHLGDGPRWSRFLGAGPPCGWSMRRERCRPLIARPFSCAVPDKLSTHVRGVQRAPDRGNRRSALTSREPPWRFHALRRRFRPRCGCSSRVPGSLLRDGRRLVRARGDRGERNVAAGADQPLG